jgi:NAD-specific glutamate dehydrogenase
MTKALKPSFSTRPSLGFLYSPLTASGQKQLYFKLYCFGHIASLSRSLPMLENMGVKVCSEHPYEINKYNQNKPFWIHDFGLTYALPYFPAWADYAKARLYDQSNRV